MDEDLSYDEFPPEPAPALIRIDPTSFPLPLPATREEWAKELGPAGPAVLDAAEYFLMMWCPSPPPDTYEGADGTAQRWFVAEGGDQATVLEALKDWAEEPGRPEARDAEYLALLRFPAGRPEPVLSRLFRLDW